MRDHSAQRGSYRRPRDPGIPPDGSPVAPTAADEASPPVYPEHDLRSRSVAAPFKELRLGERLRFPNGVYSPLLRQPLEPDLLRQLSNTDLIESQAKPETEA